MFDVEPSAPQGEPVVGVTSGAVRASLERCVDIDPGAESLMALLSIDPSSLELQEAVTFLQALERHLAWLHAVQAQALYAAAGPAPSVTKAAINAVLTEPFDITVEEIAREEIACATRWSTSLTQHRIDTARLLMTSLADTLHALAGGQISHAHATAIADAAESLPGFGSINDIERHRFEVGCARLQERALQAARAGSVARTRNAAASVVASMCHDDSAERRRRQRLAYQVSLTDDADGASTIIARMAPHHAHACMAAIQQLSRHPQLDVPCDATAGERRAHAMATLIIGPHPAATPGSAYSDIPSLGRHSDSFGVTAPRRQAQSLRSSAAGRLAQVEAEADLEVIGPRPRMHLNVVISLEALLALSNQPAQIPGAGPIPAEIVRGLLGDATMRRLVTDPMTGHLLDYGRRTYQVPDRLRDFIVARDQTCRFPGCNRRARDCQVDHATPWNGGGTTDLGNLGALCLRHHQLKTHAGWQILNSGPTGACTWRSPHGRVYEHQSPPLIDPSTPPRSRPSSAGSQGATESP